MKVKELIETLQGFDQELEVCTCDFSEWDVDYVYNKYTSIPTLRPSKLFNKYNDTKIKGRLFLCL